MLVNPAELLAGTVLIIVPHMDDGVLAVGGTIASTPSKENIHVVYATDGMGSPEPIIPWRDQITPDLGATRMQEAQAAMGYLGVSQEQIHFMALPDGQLNKHRDVLKQRLFRLIEDIQPDVVMLPFRYDRHPDHLAVNKVMTAAAGNGLYRGILIEYFVYTNWRLLPERDVRRYIRQELLYEVDTSEACKHKRTALDFFKSQTTRFYSWQLRPNLTPQLLDKVSQSPEYFLRYDAALPGPAIFDRMVPWIQTAHRLEPFLKKRKDQAVALWSRWGGA